MADIKSTMDIIMERTKNLTMTEEEKKAFHRKDWADKAVRWMAFKQQLNTDFLRQLKSLTDN